MIERSLTTVVVEPSRRGWLCTCGSYYYQSQSAIEAVRDAHDHQAVVHSGRGLVATDIREDRNHGHQ